MQEKTINNIKKKTSGTDDHYLNTLEYLFYQECGTDFVFFDPEIIAGACETDKQKKKTGCVFEKGTLVRKFGINLDEIKDLEKITLKEALDFHFNCYHQNKLSLLPVEVSAYIFDTIKERGQNFANRCVRFGLNVQEFEGELTKTEEKLLRECKHSLFIDLMGIYRRINKKSKNEDQKEIIRRTKAMLFEEMTRI